MKSLRKILFSIIMILVLTLNYVNAAEPEVQITGDSEAKAGETKTLILKIVSDEDIGIFSGKLTKDANIDDVILEEKNNWDLISGENGTFKLMKPQGAKKEDVLAITYKIKEGATGKANITISSIDLTTIEYETKKATDISKDISIKEEAPVKELSNIEITKAPNKTSYKAGESFDKTGIEITAKYSDGTTKVITNYTYAPKNELSEENTKITISYTENGVTKTAEQKIIVEKKVVIDGNNNNDNNNNNNNPSNSGNANNGSSNNNANNNGSTNNNSQNPVIVIGKGEGKDTTVANKELAKAGATHITLYAALGMIALGIVFYKKYTSI